MNNSFESKRMREDIELIGCGSLLRSGRPMDTNGKMKKYGEMIVRTKLKPREVILEVAMMQNVFVQATMRREK